jgi:hypothetical protein
MTTEAAPGNVPLSDLLGLGAMLPACWTLTETLDANQTTSFGHLWFTNPKNTAWEPLYRRAAIDRVLAHARVVHSFNAHLHDRNSALMLLISDLGAVMARMGAGIDHLDKLAREWEPDHSSGADRAGWVRAKDAADEARCLMAGIPGRLKA